MCSRMLLMGLLLCALCAGPAQSRTDSHLVGWWTFDEGAGDVVHDFSSQGNDGAVEGNPEWVAGVLGGAMGFSGDGDQIKLASILPIGPTSNTVTAWIKIPLAGTEGLDATERVGIILGTYNDSPNSNWELHAAGQLRMWWNGGEVDARGTTDLRDNTWHHVAWVRDKIANASTMYIDGVSEATVATVGSDVTFTTTHRIGADNRGSSTPNFHGQMDDLQVYSRALSQEEVQSIMGGPIDYSLASSPTPANGAVDVPRDAVLAWKPGLYAATHNVYFGTEEADVNEAGPADARGVLVSQEQTMNAYDPADLLQFEQTYYWRIDEVNALPDGTVFRGPIWSFTVEPVAYPLAAASMTAVAASSAGDDEGPDKTIDRSGLDEADLHSVRRTDMWLSGDIPAGESAWIQFDFDKAYALHAMQVWNHNSELESMVGLGAKAATIQYSADGIEWTTLGDVELARASGRPDQAASTVIDLEGAIARTVRLSVHSNWGGILPQYGLSEVRFLYVPMRARQAEPNPGADGIAPKTQLTWRAGREAVMHNVYLSNDEQAVFDGAALVETVAETGYEAILDLDTTYYWRVDEVNEAADPSIWEGDVWSFATQQYLVVDDFESYTDDEGNRIYETWIDGWDNDTGSQVGYMEAPFAELRIVNSGRQSMPLTYDNTAAPFYSEAERSFDMPQDWTMSGIESLTLQFRGEIDNEGQLYIKINGTKVPYDGDAADLAKALWHSWNIDLSIVEADLTNVAQLAIGIEGANAKGILYIDDIRLYPSTIERVTPVAPDDAHLVHFWTFDEGAGAVVQDAGAQGNNGAILGNPQWITGMVGGALQFDGDGDEIPLASPLTIGSSSNTVAAWIKVPLAGTEGLGATQRVGILLGSYPDSPNTNWELHSAGQMRLYWNGGEINANGKTDLRDNTWHHIVWVRDKETDACYMYIDGRLEATATTAGTDVVFETTHRIGADNRVSGVPYFNGGLDDLRVYENALSPAEIAWLAGLRKPIQSPF